MILDTVTYREILREIAFREYTSNQSILTEYYMLVTYTCCINTFIIRSKFTSSQALGVEHTVSVQVSITLLQGTGESNSLFAERCTFSLFIPSSQRSSCRRIEGDFVPAFAHCEHRTFNTKKELRTVGGTGKGNSRSDNRMCRNIIGSAVIHTVYQALYGSSKLHKTFTCDRLMACCLGCCSSSSIIFSSRFLCSRGLHRIDNTVKYRLYLGYLFRRNYICLLFHMVCSQIIL